MDNVSMNEDIDANSPEKKKKKLITTLIVVFVSVIVLNFMIYKFFVPISWSRFNDKRIEYIEDTLKLDLDNIEPLSYRHITAQDHIADFDFKVDDYKSFMEDDFHGKAILRITESDDKSSVKYWCWVEEMSGSYDKCFDVTFTKADDGYNAELFCYRYVGELSNHSKETTALE